METKQMPDLSQFYGTEQYHKLTMGNLKFTDGWKHIATELGAFWLADIIGSVQNLPKIKKNNSFIVWRIVVEDNKKAIVYAHSDVEDDGSYSKKKELYNQKIPLTDFPKGTFLWYQCDDVILLVGEY